MPSYLRYGVGAVGLVVVLVVAFAPLASMLVDAWSQRDLELRSKLLFNSIKDYAALQLAEGHGEQLGAFLERLTEDEKLLALGYCDERGVLRFATKLMPASFSCEALARADTATFSIVESGVGRTLVAAFPIDVHNARGHLAVLHDMSFVASRSSQAMFYWGFAIAGAGIVFVSVAALFVFFLLRQWLHAVRQSIRQVDGSASVPIPPRTVPLLGAELRQLIREVRHTPYSVEAIQVEWSPRTLQLLLSKELPGVEILVLSNREPYIHNRTDAGIVMQIPASGLVAALEPVMRACGGTWIAHGSGSADRETVDSRNRITVPPDDPAYTLRRVWLTDAEQDGYYYGLANEGLWPLCHISFVPPHFRESDWRTYQDVNRRFADAVAQEAKTEEPIVLVQDYHFAVLPRLLKQRMPRATIVTFWHIPWPNAETFGICPWKEEIVGGLLGSTILGFHTQFGVVTLLVDGRRCLQRVLLSSRSGHCSPRPHSFAAKLAKCLTANQVTLNVEGIVDGGVC